MENGKKAYKTSLLREFFHLFLKSGSSKLGACLFVIIVLACLLGPLLSPYDPSASDLTQMFAAPSASHLLGCDAMGRDYLTRLLYGGRYSLLLAITAALCGAAAGTVIGCIAGYFGGAIETLIMRIMDVWSALPAMLLCILISTVVGAGFWPTIVALSLGAVPGGVRMVRGQILVERNKEYIEAAESINCPKAAVMFKHLLPNVIQPMIIITTMGIGSTIMMTASLSYIGLGVQPPTPEWGAMLADGRAYIRLNPHLIMFPGIFIALTVLALNLLGDGIRDALDPKLRD